MIPVAFVDNMEDAFDVTLGPDEIRTLAYAVNEAIRLWPGSPARPAEEQEMLYDLKMLLFTLSLEMSFPDNGKHSEDDSPR